MLIIYNSDFHTQIKIVYGIAKHSKNSNLMEKLRHLAARQDCIIAVNGYYSDDKFSEFSLAWYKDKEHYNKGDSFMIGGLVKHDEKTWGIHT